MAFTLILRAEHHVVMWRDVLQQRETITERLADVIKVIQLGRKTGTLTVERGQNATFEEGIVTFVHGQVTHASVGSRSGQEALSRLQTWQHCMFAFLEPTNDTPASPFQRPNSPYTSYVSNQGIRTSPERANTFASTNRAPCHTRPVEEALLLLGSTGLSRTHRRILLLIDGRREVSEIARLVGRNVEEVSQQLQELEQAGFIRQ